VTAPGLLRCFASGVSVARPVTAAASHVLICSRPALLSLADLSMRAPRLAFPHHQALESRRLIPAPTLTSTLTHTVSHGPS